MNLGDFVGNPVESSALPWCGSRTVRGAPTRRHNRRKFLRQYRHRTGTHRSTDRTSCHRVAADTTSEVKLAVLRSFERRSTTDRWTAPAESAGKRPQCCSQAHRRYTRLLKATAIRQPGKPLGTLHLKRPRNLKPDIRISHPLRRQHRHRRNHQRNRYLPEGSKPRRSKSGRRRSGWLCLQRRRTRRDHRRRRRQTLG